MGTSSLSASKSTPPSSKRPILEDYIPKKKITDPRYGEATLLQHKLSKDLSILKELTTNDSKEFVSTLLKWQNRLEMQHPNIIQVLGIEKKVESLYCSNFYKTFVLFEYIKNDLNEEMATKILEETHYLEEDLFFFLYCIITALVYYKVFNVSHGDLQPTNIFISQSGVYKIVDHTLFNNVSSYMQIQWNPHSSHNNIYLSPDLMKSLSKDLVQPLHNENKSDIFTLGMIVLHMATLDNCDKCYDYSGFKIKQEEVEMKLASLKKKYTDKLFFFVKGMLIEDEKSRPDYEDLLNMFHGSYEIKTDYRFKELLNHPIKMPLNSLIDSKTYELINSKKHDEIERNDTFPLEGSKPIPEANKNVFGNLLQKAFKQINSPEIEHKVPESEFEPANPKTLDSNDEYLNLLLLKEGRVPENPISIKKNDDISHSFSSSNISPLILKQSNKLNLKPQNLILKKSLPDIIKKNFPHHDLKTDKPQETSEYYSSGAKYEGQKLNNKRHGKGTFFYSDGGRYEGDWKDDMIHGYGLLYYPDGILAYKGYWALDKFHGYGILYNKKAKKTGGPLDWRDFGKLGEHWTSYEGDFRVDNKEGYGLMYLSNGEKYIGEFKNDKVCGEGNFYAKNGTIINGRWENNVYSE